MIVSNEAVAEYVGSRVGAKMVEPYTTLGIEQDGRIVAGIVFNVWTGPDAQLSLAAEPGNLSRRFLRRVGRYLTEEMGCVRATIETEQPHVIEMALRMGGKIEGVKRNLFGPGRDGTIIGVLKEDWFLK